MALSDIAAALPWPVFACGEDKRPVVETGFKAATRDVATIRAQFARTGAILIGVPTGRVSGIVVVDIDIKEGRDGRRWLDANRDALPETRTHKTLSGGLHLVFLTPGNVEIRNSASRLAPGVDVRGEGGYVIVPPSPGYSVADDIDPAEMPGWLIRACMRQETPVEIAARPQERHERYTQAAIDGEVTAVAGAPEGTRNDTLNRAAVKLGTLVAAHQMARATAEAELLHAAQFAGLPAREAIATIRSGLDFGITRPREMPERATARPNGTSRTPNVPTDVPANVPGDVPRDDAPAEPAHEPFPLLLFEDIEPVLDTRDFVQGLLTEQGAAVVYGESNAGKTFWATDLALHVAAGQTWSGKRVEHGGVIYCALEGGFGFRNRVAAWKESHGFNDYFIPFAAITRSVNLLDPKADTDNLISAIQQAATTLRIKVVLVVVDTLSRAMAGGNENAPDDMGALVFNMDRIRQETGACVLFIHHSGKDTAKGARGHSLLRAAVDTEIEVVADDGGHTATVVKQRELPKGQSFPFNLKVVEIGVNRHGEPVTTCLVETGDGQTAGAVPEYRRRHTGHNKRALEVLADLVATSGQGGHTGVPTGFLSVPEKWWRERFYERAMPGAEAQAKKKAFRRAADALISDRSVGMADGRVWHAERQNNMDP